MAGMLAHCAQMKVAHVNSQTRLCRKLSVTFFTTQHSLLLFMLNLEDKNRWALTSLEIVCTWTWFSSWSGFLKAWSHRVQGNCGGPWDQLCLVSSRCKTIDNPFDTCFPCFKEERVNMWKRRMKRGGIWDIITEKRDHNFVDICHLECTQQNMGHSIFYLVVKHQGTLGALQLRVLVHHGHVALQVAYLWEHLSTVATWELFNCHLKSFSSDKTKYIQNLPHPTHVFWSCALSGKMPVW